MNNIRYFNSPAEMAGTAADLIAKLSADAIRKGGRFSIALSGGNTPAALYSLLANEPYLSRLDWKNIYFFWGDERCVSAKSTDNNSHNAKQVLLDHVTVPSENIFPVPVNLPPVEAAVQYMKTLEDFFKAPIPEFDLILLGMGDNGHTASLFPHTPILHEKKATVKEVYVEELKMNRISFTAPLINHAAHILFLVAGKEKTPMLKNVLEGPYEPANYPAQLIKNAEWYISRT